MKGRTVQQTALEDTTVNANAAGNLSDDVSRQTVLLDDLFRERHGPALDASFEHMLVAVTIEWPGPYRPQGTSAT